VASVAIIPFIGHLLSKSPITLPFVSPIGRRFAVGKPVSRREKAVLQLRRILRQTAQQNNDTLAAAIGI
jgi:hypothetical protein